MAEKITILVVVSVILFLIGTLIDITAASRQILPDSGTVTNIYKTKSPFSKRTQHKIDVVYIFESTGNISGIKRRNTDILTFEITEEASSRLKLNQSILPDELDEAIGTVYSIVEVLNK